MSDFRSLAALLAKELRVLWLGLVIGLPICLLQATTFLAWERAGYVVFLAAATLVISMAGAVVDSRYGVEPLFASLPVRRSIVVASRFLWCALVVAAMACLTAGVAGALAALEIRGVRESATRGLEAEHIILFLLLTGLPLALFLPFHYRWGLGPGAARFLVASGALAALAGGGAVLARGAGWQRGPRVGELTSALVAAWGPTASVLAVATAVAAFGVGSYLLSATFSARRDL